MKGLGHLRILFGDRTETLDEGASLLALACAVKFLQFTHHGLDLFGTQGITLEVLVGRLSSRILRAGRDGKKHQPGGKHRNQAAIMEGWFHGMGTVGRTVTAFKPPNIQ